MINLNQYLSQHVNEGEARDDAREAPCVLNKSRIIPEGSACQAYPNQMEQSPCFFSMSEYSVLLVVRCSGTTFFE